MNQLDHPGIVSVSAYLQTPAAIVMELVPGADISAWNPFEEFEDALDFIYETAKSLSYAHGVSVIHRDLKPANILAVADGEKYRPVITDFDLAWFSTATKITKEAMGYAFYAAPEQIQSPNHPATREPTVDVYSLMQVFFYLVVGQDPKPFDLQDNVQRLKRTLESTLKGDGHVDSVVRAYLAGSALSPRQRTSDMQALLKDLREVKESTYAEPVDVEATFVDFCQRAAIQAGWTQIHLANSTKITASSPSTRSTFEIIHEARPNRIIVRVKTFDLANATNVRRKDFFSVHQARVTAGLSADGDAIKVPLGGGLFVVQFAYEYGRLTSREAESFAARVRKVYSAMERTK